MELKLSNGKYVVGADGTLECVSGAEEKIQRILCRLSARRGGFFPMPEFGSRLYKLSSMKPSARNAAAQQYVHEALAAEEGVELLGVDCVSGPDDSCVVNVELAIDGEGSNMTFMV